MTRRVRLALILGPGAAVIAAVLLVPRLCGCGTPDAEPAPAPALPAPVTAAVAAIAAAQEARYAADEWYVHELDSLGVPEAAELAGAEILMASDRGYDLGFTVDSGRRTCTYSVRRVDGGPGLRQRTRCVPE